MTEQEKKLYKKVKDKHYRNFNRIVKKIFAEHFDKLKHRTIKDAETIGSFLTVLEMEMKKELKQFL